MNDPDSADTMARIRTSLPAGQSPAPQAEAGRVARARAALEAVPDPEIPVVSIRELGILREVVVAPDGCVEAVITPTYSGCPAMSQIAEDAGAALDCAGIGPWRVRTVLAPAWTTDWITEEGRAKLLTFGIAPPGRCGTESAAHHDAAPAARPLRFVPRAAGAHGDESISCPRCGSIHTTPVSHFASTACKALYRCLDCREPFDYFKPY